MSEEERQVLLHEAAAKNRDGWPGIHIAAERGDLKSLRAYLDAGADINMRAVHNRTPLITAIRSDNKEVIAFLLERGADVLAESNNGWNSLIHVAQFSSDPQLVKYLVERGLSVNSLSNGNYTPLMIACRYRGHPDVIRALLEAGADKDAVMPGYRQTAAMLAARYHPDEAVMKILIQAGVDLSVSGSDGRNALMLAASYSGNPEVLKAIVSAGQSVRTLAFSGYDLLKQAARWNRDNTAMIQTLLDYGMDVNVQGRSGESALMLAAQFNSIEVVRLLLEAGAEPNVVDRNGRNVLTYAMSNYTDNEGIVRILLEKGVNANVRDSQDRSLGYYMLAKCSPDTLRLMLKNGFDAKEVGNDGVPVLMQAARSNPHAEVIRILLEQGLDVKNMQDRMGVGVLGYAAFSNPNEEIIRMLLDAGCPVNGKSQNGDTPVLSSAANNNMKVMQLLLDVGGELDVKNNAGETPLMRASRSNPNPAMVPFLLERGQNLAERDNQGMSALLYAAAHNELPVVQELIGWKADMKDVDGDGANALLLAAATNRYVDVVNWLVDIAAFDLDYRDSHQRTALHYATNKNREQMSYELLELGAEPNMVDAAGETPLMNAVKSHSLALVERIIWYGGEVNKSNQEQKTALMYALARGSKEIIEHLLDQGAEVNVLDADGKSVLMYAAERSPLDIVKKLVEKGADMSVHSKSGENVLVASFRNSRSAVPRFFLSYESRVHSGKPMRNEYLFLAVKNRSMGAFDALVRSGADMRFRNDQQDTLLMTMASLSERNAHDMRPVIEAGVDVNAVNANGDTALIIALKSGAAEDKINMLVSSGARFGFRNQAGEDAMSIARSHPQYAQLIKAWEADESKWVFHAEEEPLRAAIVAGEDLAKISALLEQEEDINGVDRFGNHILWYALSRNDGGELVELLLERKADPHAKDSQGRSLLEAAVENGYPTAGILSLLRAGVKVGERNARGRDTLVMALLRRYDGETVKALIAAGGDIKGIDYEGKTPLIHAVLAYRYQSPELVQGVMDVLREAGVPLDARDKHGKTAMEYVQESGDERMMEIFQNLM